MAQKKHLELEVLLTIVQKALIECGNQLKSAPFEDNGKFEYIGDRNMLEEESQNYVKLQSAKVSL